MTHAEKQQKFNQATALATQSMNSIVLEMVKNSKSEITSLEDVAKDMSKGIVILRDTLMEELPEPKIKVV